MKKILFITNISKGVSSFSLASVKAAKELGLDYYLAGNFSIVPKEKILDDEKEYGVTIKEIDLVRSPFSFKNISAYKELVKFVKEEKIDYIHCNTPIGGVLGRLVAQKCDVKRVIYQAHGFHFYTGSPLKNWLMYYPIEKWLAHKTDAIITINKEDYERATRKFKLRNHGKVYYVPGVGIDLSSFTVSDKTRIQKRKELELEENDIALISVGELNENKNNRIVIEAMSKIEYNKLHYFLCGVGSCETELRNLAESFGVNKQVHFLGYRNDVKDLYQASDIFIMPSFREGLSRSIMEAMASGLPCVVSNVRGNTDLVNEFGGYTCDPKKSIEFAKSLLDLINDPKKRLKMGQYNQDKITDFSIERVSMSIKKTYRREFDLI